MAKFQFSIQTMPPKMVDGEIVGSDNIIVDTVIESDSRGEAMQSYLKGKEGHVRGDGKWDRKHGDILYIYKTICVGLETAISTFYLKEI